MNLTDTPQKELLKSCKKVQKAPKRKAIKTLENVCTATKVQTLMRYRFLCQMIHLTTFQTLVMLKKISLSQTALISLQYMTMC